MPKSWVNLIILGMVILIIITGYQIFLSLTGRNQTRVYSVIEINGSFNDKVLNFLESKQGEIKKSEDDI